MSLRRLCIPSARHLTGQALQQRSATPPPPISASTRSCSTIPNRINAVGLCLRHGPRMASNYDQPSWTECLSSIVAQLSALRSASRPKGGKGLPPDMHSVPMRTDRNRLRMCELNPRSHTIATEALPMSWALLRNLVATSADPQVCGRVWKASTDQAQPRLEQLFRASTPTRPKWKSNACSRPACQSQIRGQWANSL